MAHQPSNDGFRTSREAALSENPALGNSPKVVVETASIGSGKAEDQFPLFVGTVSAWGVRLPFETEKKRGVVGPIPDPKWVCLKLETLNEEGNMFHSWKFGTKHLGFMQLSEVTVGCEVYVPLDGSLSAHMNIGRQVMHNDEYVQAEVRIRPYQPSAFRGEGVEEEEEEELEEVEEEDEENNEEVKEGEDLDSEARGGGSSEKKRTANKNIYTEHKQQMKKASISLLKTTNAVSIQDWIGHARQFYPGGLPHGLLEPIVPGVLAITMSPYGNLQCSMSTLWKQNGIVMECVNNVLWALQVYLEETVRRAKAKILLGEKAGTQPSVGKDEGTTAPSNKSQQYYGRLKTASRAMHKLVLHRYDSQREHSAEEVNVFYTYWSKPDCLMLSLGNIFPSFNFQTLNPKTMCEPAVMKPFSPD